MIRFYILACSSPSLTYPNVLSFICILMICFEALMVTPSRILACLFRLRICRVTNGITVLMVKYSSSFRNICSLYYAALRIQFYLYSEFAYKFSCLAKPVLARFQSLEHNTCLTNCSHVCGNTHRRYGTLYTKYTTLWMHGGWKGAQYIYGIRVHCQNTLSLQNSVRPRNYQAVCSVCY